MDSGNTGKNMQLNITVSEDCSRNINVTAAQQYYTVKPLFYSAHCHHFSVRNYCFKLQ